MVARRICRRRCLLRPVGLPHHAAAVRRGRRPGHHRSRGLLASPRQAAAAERRPHARIHPGRDVAVAATLSLAWDFPRRSGCGNVSLELPVFSQRDRLLSFRRSADPCSAFLVAEHRRAVLFCLADGSVPVAARHQAEAPARRQPAACGDRHRLVRREPLGRQRQSTGRVLRHAHARLAARHRRPARNQLRPSISGYPPPS